MFPYWLRTSLSLVYELAFGGGLKWWRPSWKELSLTVLNRVNTEVCNIFTSADHLLIEILFSHPIDILKIYWIIIPWAYLSCLLMDYAIECANIIYYHHMLVLLGCWGLVAGIFLWFKVSTMDFIECLDEVGLLSCLSSIFAYIK